MAKSPLKTELWVWIPLLFLLEVNKITWWQPCLLEWNTPSYKLLELGDVNTPTELLTFSLGEPVPADPEGTLPGSNVSLVKFLSHPPEPVPQRSPLFTMNYNCFCTSLQWKHSHIGIRHGFKRQPSTHSNVDTESSEPQCPHLLKTAATPHHRAGTELNRITWETNSHKQKFNKC